jgi:hypothetical protein
MSFNQEYNDKMAEALRTFGIPTDNVMADPACDFHPGGVILEPRFFVAYKDMTEEQKAALYAASGVEWLK